MSDTSPHTFFYEATRADVASDLPKEGISIAFRQSDGGSITAVIIPLEVHKANIERIRQLEEQRERCLDTIERLLEALGKAEKRLEEKS